ncbi:MAG: 50S ribosomal protein L29 [Opitutales bacterium]|nr:50S ribosomal protein L29 [Opitutales bacterium]
MKKHTFKDLSISDLANKERELRGELQMLTLKKRVGQVAKPHRFSEIRRDIARIMTAKRLAQ